MEEKQLFGGNTHASIVRSGDTVRRPTGPWTPAIHDLLRHLERKNFDGAPRVLGIDEHGREMLTFVPGDVIYPDHIDLMMTDEALEAIARLIRRYHDSVADFEIRASHAWSERGSDDSGEGELLCHNDLAPWNLVHTPEGRWVFIDWDLAAPGPRSWDLAWALLTFIPLMPGNDIDRSEIAHRLALFRDTYGAHLIEPDVIDVAAARCTRETDLIATLGRKGEPPYDRLLAEGHFDIWSHAAAHVKEHADVWKSALS